MHNRTSKQRKSAQKRNATYAALHNEVAKLREQIKKLAPPKATAAAPTKSAARG